ncbi:MAG: 2-dehydro-3-deoxygalactonokinase [Inquilinus sp.]|nr:2-dehydro-3-deoxygalactonokinase [Inquilinus sp.]
MEDANPDTALIGLDWGTSGFRAYRLGGDGRILDRFTDAAGILAVADGDFDAAMEARIGAWLDAAPSAPLLASGMIGSRQGWVEAAYVDRPAGAAQLAAGMVAQRTRQGRTIHFVPGIAGSDGDGVPDVMRGEETQIVGAALGGRQVFLLPGTHSKWALVEDGRVVWFATFMTGELFAVLKSHSILGRLVEGETEDADAFRRGLAHAPGPGHGGLLHRLFSARTLALFGRLPGSGVASYLSGLLIGAEIAEAREAVPSLPAAEPITIVGGSALAARYAEALATLGMPGRTAEPDTAARGLYRLAIAAGLIEEAGR